MILTGKLRKGLQLLFPALVKLDNLLVLGLLLDAESVLLALQEQFLGVIWVQGR